MSDNNNKDTIHEEQAVEHNSAGINGNDAGDLKSGTVNNVDSTNLDSNGIPIPEKIQDNTFKDSTKRLGGNGKLRFVVAGTVTTVLLVGIGAKYTISSLSKPPVPDAQSTVAVPKTNAAASAVASPEQAQYLKERQAEAGEKAEQKGETYLPEFITTRDQQPEVLAPPTQPGVNPNAIRAKEFRDLAGNVYTAEKAAELAAQGVELEGVTVGRGSISDPNLGNISENTNTNSTQPTRVEIAPYVVTPLSTANSSPNAAKSESSNSEIEALDKSAKDAEQWSKDYFDVRLKKAQMVDQKTQLAFERQVLALTEATKPVQIKNASSGFSSVVFHTPKEPEEKPDLNIAQTESADKNYFKPIIFAGESYRAILRNEVNTDNGSEVIATLQNGPLKGSTIMGTVQITKGNINFNFNRLLRKNKDEINISAIGRQIGTNSSGMADEINKHYLKRYTALVVSQALKGVGEAYEQTAGVSATSNANNVIVESSDPSAKRIQGNIAGEIGNELSNEIKAAQQTPTTYITHSGKVFNVFFNQGVRENPENNSNKK